MRKIILKILVLTILLLLGAAVACSSAAIITVDCNGFADFTSIQEAINNALLHDTIVVCPCKVAPYVYYENINFYEKPLTITSTNPNDINVVSTTVIDGNGMGNVVTFNNVDIEASVLIGLTIQNGENGIDCCEASYPLIKNCVVADNNSDGIQASSSALPG